MASSTKKKPETKTKKAETKTKTRKAKSKSAGRAKGATTGKTRRPAPKRRGRPAKTSPPVMEPVRENDDITALDLLFMSAARLFRLHKRSIAKATLLILLLCDALTLPDVFTQTPSEGILVVWISVLFRGLMGYGYLLTVPALAGALVILCLRDGLPVKQLVACALLIPPLFGMLGHLLLPGAALITDEGLVGCIRGLWYSGEALASGGVLSGGLAELFRAFFSQFVALILLLIVIYKISAHFDFMRRPQELYEEDDDAYMDDDAFMAQEPERGLLERARDWWDVRRNAWEQEPPRRQKKSVTKEKKARLEKEEYVPEKALEDGRDVPQWELEDKRSVPEEKPVKEKKKRGRPKKEKEATVHEEVRAESDRVGRDITREMSHGTEDYVSPSVTLLRKNASHVQQEDRAELNYNARRLQDTLRSFDVNAVSEGEPVHGPSITRYDFKLEQGVKLSKIMNLADDIALSLGSSGVRIAPIQNRKSVVGIEVPNAQKTPVLLRDVVESQKFISNPSATTFALGKDISGDVVTGCIEELPHVLIAGTTGSGKSVCTNSMIISLLYKSSPEQLRFIMIDPKMVELAPYNGIPHLLIPVVTDPRKAAGALQWAVTEMMKRYKTFSENGVKKLAEYQRMAAKKKELEPLPSVVVVIDELADLMMVAAKEVEESIMRVAQMGRAAGIHLVIATQRPSADIITGLMKANIPSRIAFAVASAMESRIILDSAGAEKLVGSGDMLYSPLGGEKKRVQGCFITPEEIEKVVSFVKGERETQYDDNVLASIDASVSLGQEKGRPADKKTPEKQDVEEQDELLPAAVDVVLETGQASVSMLQRRLKLGYSRAARLVDQMERYGYVGPFEGSRPRQLLITREQWQEKQMTLPPTASG